MSGRCQLCTANDREAVIDRLASELATAAIDSPDDLLGRQ